MVKRHKYNATRTVVDGITFASKAEARRYAELKLLERAGEISRPITQFKIPLHAGLKTKIGHYIADFSYFKKDGTAVYEDVKGCRVGPAYALFRWKKRHVEAQYGIKIVEIK